MAINLFSIFSSINTISTGKSTRNIANNIPPLALRYAVQYGRSWHSGGARQEGGRDRKSFFLKTVPVSSLGSHAKQETNLKQVQYLESYVFGAVNKFPLAKGLQAQNAACYCTGFLHIYEVWNILWNAYMHKVIS